MSTYTHFADRDPLLDHLPERDRPAVKRRLRADWKFTGHHAAIERLEALASELAAFAPRRGRVAAGGPRGDRHTAASRRFTGSS